MNPYRAYQNQMGGNGQTRIDVVLALYEALIDRCERALAAVRGNDQATLRRQLAAGVFGLTGLVNASEGRTEEVALSLRRVYKFVADCLANPNESRLVAALNSLRGLHESFLAIRAQAVELERRGEISPIRQEGVFQARA